MAYSSTNTPLGANGVYTGPVQITERADNISGTVIADQAGTLFVEQSSDGNNWDLSESITIVANTGQGFSKFLYAPYVRLRYVNGGVAQGVFRLYSRFTSASVAT